MSLALAAAVPATADDNYGVYGNHGYHWMARYDDYALLLIVSNNCSRTPRETAAWARVINSTAGTSQFAGKWPSGIIISTADCQASLEITDDINLVYSDFDETHGGGNFAGENHKTLATASYCSYWDAPYPCGMHLSNVHINDDFWAGASNNSRERLLMHETGHSLRLAHHCSSDSIMNDGSQGCNGGAWTSVMVYKPTDRDGIVDIYPNWQYP